MAARVTAYWRDSARSPRFFFVDALAALPMVVFLLHVRKWTFILALLVTIFFGILERFNFTFPVFVRWARSTFAGPIKVAKPTWRN